MKTTQNINVRGLTPLVSPRELLADLPMTEAANRTVVEGRAAIERILRGEDPRLIAVVGPCSIHDETAALDYAAKLREAARAVEDQLLVLMRVYFEKPRTTVGWKGMISDPRLDDSGDMATGLRKAREILLKVNELGLPAASEMLDPITPQYTADLVTWASIGARTIESQTHRQMASGLSMPVGFKNPTDGNIQTAIDAMTSARTSHAFLGIDAEGRICIVQTKGNPWGHIILRGGRSGSNYDAETIAAASARLESAGLHPQVMVDCSHANSNKDYRKQSVAWRDVVRQRCAGNARISGLMLESNLEEGNQKVPAGGSPLRYGVSITDACIGWNETKDLLIETRESLLASRPEPASVR